MQNSKLLVAFVVAVLSSYSVFANASWTISDTYVFDEAFGGNCGFFTKQPILQIDNKVYVRARSGVEYAAFGIDLINKKIVPNINKSVSDELLGSIVGAQNKKNIGYVLTRGSSISFGNSYVKVNRLIDGDSFEYLTTLGVPYSLYSRSQVVGGETSIAMLSYFETGRTKTEDKLAVFTKQGDRWNGITEIKQPKFTKLIGMSNSGEYFVTRRGKNYTEFRHLLYRITGSNIQLQSGSIEGQYIGISDSHLFMREREGPDYYLSIRSLSTGDNVFYERYSDLLLPDPTHGQLYLRMLANNKVALGYKFDEGSVHLILESKDDYGYEWDIVFKAILERSADDGFQGSSCYLSINDQTSLFFATKPSQVKAYLLTSSGSQVNGVAEKLKNTVNIKVISPTEKGIDKYTYYDQHPYGYLVWTHSNEFDSYEIDGTSSPWKQMHKDIYQCRAEDCRRRNKTCPGIAYSDWRAIDISAEDNCYDGKCYGVIPREAVGLETCRNASYPIEFKITPKAGATSFESIKFQFSSAPLLRNTVGR